MEKPRKTDVCEAFPTQLSLRRMKQLRGCPYRSGNRIFDFGELKRTRITVLLNDD